MFPSTEASTRYRVTNFFFSRNYNVNRRSRSISNRNSLLYIPHIDISHKLNLKNLNSTGCKLGSRKIKSRKQHL